MSKGRICPAPELDPGREKELEREPDPESNPDLLKDRFKELATDPRRSLSSPKTPWPARLSVEVEPGVRGGILGRISRQGPLTVSRPFYAADVLELALIHPPGGLVEGDDLRVDILARPASRVLFTTTSAQKVYRARDWQSQSINLTARGDGLEWLPRETIVFSGAKGRLSLWVDVEPTSRFIGWDLVNFGAGAEFSEGILIQELTIKRAERLVFRERARVSGGDRFLPSALGYGGRSVAASLWALGRAGASDEDLLSQVASKVPQNQKGALTGITLRGGLLVARYLGSAMERAWDWLETVWRAIRELWGGRLFRPRLWST